MKKNNKRALTMVLCAILLASSLSSCSDATEDDSLYHDNTATEQQTLTVSPSIQEQNSSKPSDKAETSKENSNDKYQNIEADTYKEQISYYMSLTESLQAELLQLKQDTYIDECEYKIQISTLEQTIQDLKDTIATLSTPTPTPTPPSSNTNDPSNDQLAARIEYKYSTANSEVTILEYIGNDIDVKIPSVINGFPVVAIGEAAFKGKQIRSVVIPSGVKSIDWFAFSACTTLESITIPSSVMSVGYGAFEYCPSSLTVKCSKGSYIEAYALSWGMKVLAE